MSRGYNFNSKSINEEGKDLVFIDLFFMKKRVLFITKNFPPQKGGMEQYSYDFYNNLKNHTKVSLIANKKGKYFLPFFGIIAIFKGLLLVPKADIIYIGDGSISFLGYFLGKIFKKEIYITIHGLDITWQNKIYQVIIPKIISKFDKIICVSSFTKEICIKKGIDKEKITVIPNGIDLKNKELKQNLDLDKDKILREIGIDFSKNQKVLFTIGRWIERKGIQWFLTNIVPNLNSDEYVYLIAGFGEYGEVYDKIVKDNKLNNVYILGKISNNLRDNLYQISDLFIIPNIYVAGDMEGFGIVAIEAGVYGLPVIASKIEGLTDAVVEEKTGILIDDDENRIMNWVDAINNFDYNKFNQKNIKKEVIKHFSWKNITKKYLELIK